jgi:hypothetical protein
MLGVNFVVEYLIERYAQKLAQEHKEDVEEARAHLLAVPEIKGFLDFSTELLNRVRPAAVTHEEANYLIQLMDGTRFAISPTFEAVAGSMQQSPFFPVTGGDTLRDLRQGGMPTTMTPMTPLDDRSKGGPAVRYDQ